MADILQIHEIHMKVSYQNDHHIYRYIESELNKCGYGYNRKHMIQINRYHRFDQSLCIIRGYLYDDPQKFIKLLEQYVDIEAIRAHDIGNEISEKEINEKEKRAHITKYIKLYEEKKKGTKIQIIEWIIGLYGELKINKNINISHLLYFLGTLEWFHLAIIKYMFSTYNEEKIFIIGESQDFDPWDLHNYNYNDLNEFVTSEYCSHTIVYMFMGKYMITYDPDYQAYDNELVQFNKLCKILEKKYMSVIPDQYIPIQDITDDHYCIFHCFWFIQRIVQMHIDHQSIVDFMEYIKRINKKTKKSDVYFFINDLNMRANLYCLKN